MTTRPMAALLAFACLAPISGCGKPATEEPSKTPTAKLPPPTPRPADAPDPTGEPAPNITPKPPPAVANTPPTSQAPKELLTDGDDEKPKPKTAEKAVGKPAAKIELKPIDLAGFDKFLAEKKGKVVVVDNWASWCVSCRAKFPHFAEMSREHAGDGFVFVAMNHDEDDDDEIEAAVEFLNDNPGTYLNFRMTDDMFDFIEKFDFDGIPRYFLFTKDGKMAVNVRDVQEVSKKVAELAKGNESK